MKNKVKRFVRICAYIWVVLIILTTFTDIIKYANGGYIKIDATITYVNYFKGRSFRSSSYNRANGYVTWEYNGVVFESDERLDFPADAVVGDSKSIWIDTETGEYAASQGIFHVIFMGVVSALIGALILKLVKVKKEKQKLLY